MSEFNWKDFEKEFSSKFKDISERLHSNFKKICVSRVHPDLVSDVMVEAYGSESKLFELANITIPSARLLVIKPYDINIVSDVVKALQKYKPEFSPVVSSDQIKISLLPPTEETRKKSVKEAKELLEQAKVAVRVFRKDQISKLKSFELSEDMEKKYMNQFDLEIKKANDQLDKLFVEKEKELMII